MNRYRVALNMPFLYEIEANDLFEAVEKAKSRVYDENGIGNIQVNVDFGNTYEIKDEDSKDFS